MIGLGGDRASIIHEARHGDDIRHAAKIRRGDRLAAEGQEPSGRVARAPRPSSGGHWLDRLMARLV